MFKGDPAVYAYYDEQKKRSISMLTTLDTVEIGIKSISSIGLSEFPLLDQDGNEFITRVELCSAVPAALELWENVVVSAAFFIEQRRNPIRPGSILEGVVKEYYPDISMPHLYFTVPFLWNHGHIDELFFSDVRINWLQCFAIHDIEKDFVIKYGADAFEDLLAEQEIDIFDTVRPHVVFS
jgi:hypothetical protein